MSNSTVVAFPKAPVNAPSTPAAPRPPSPSPPSPAYTVSIAPSPVGTLPASKSQSSFYISWFGIVGILAAFLVLAIIALVCFWYKRNAYKKALQEQRNYYIQNAARIHSDASDDEEQNRSKRGQMTLADWALPDWTPKRSNGGVNPFFGDSPTSVERTEERIVEQDIPVYTRAKKPLRGSRDRIVPGSFRDKHMNHCDSPGSPVGEVFYTGEEGSQMGAFRFSRAELGSIEILTRVSTPKKRKAESESASLLGNLNRSHTIAATPTREERNKLGGWSLRTFSLPAYHRKPSPESVLTSWGLRGETRLEALRKPISPLTPQPSSLPASPAHSFFPSAHRNNLTPASWARKPSRLSVQSSAAVHSPTFVVPPSTPPPPLPLPVTVDETDGKEKTLKELRRDLKQAESKWTIAPYCPSAPPPPLPVPFQAPASPAPPPRRSPLGLGSLPDVNSPPPFRVLFQAPAPPPPPPPPPRRSVTLPPKLLAANGGGGRTDPPPPPPPPSSLPSLPGRKLTPPPSPPPFPDNGRKLTLPPSPPSPPTPPPSPPPPPLPVGGAASGPGSAPRPKLTPLMLPGRPDLGENLEDLRAEQRSSKRHQKMRPLHWDKLKPDSDRTVWDNISNSME